MANLSKKIFVLLFSGLIFWLNTASAQEGKTTCSIKDLKYFSLMDDEHEIAANYVPILPLRTFAHADIYKEKKSAQLIRSYYLKDASGNYGNPYEKISLNITVKGNGLFGREVFAIGTLNQSVLKYQNIMRFSLPKKAHMEVDASLDNVPILDLTVHSDGDKMTNEVEGTFLNKEVNYKTDWRETKGLLAGIPYNLHTEGVEKTPTSYKGVTKGKINNTSISGEARLVSPGIYETIEYYGPIMVKSTIKVL